MAGELTGPRGRQGRGDGGGDRPADERGDAPGDAPDDERGDGRNGGTGRGRDGTGNEARDATAPAARLLRVSFAPGTGREEADAPALFQLEAGGPGIVDPAGRATLAIDEPPRARLTTSVGGEPATRAVLLTPLPDVRRAAAGVERVEVVIDGWRFELDVESDARARLRERATGARASAGKGGPSELRAIIPGRVVSVDVAEGDTVEAGGRLLVLEAMKMQNEVRAPRAGTVARLAVGPGQTVELGDVLLVIE